MTDWPIDALPLAYPLARRLAALLATAPQEEWSALIADAMVACVGADRAARAEGARDDRDSERD